MSDLENALYADARLVDLYDLLNSGDWVLISTES